MIDFINKINNRFNINVWDLSKKIIILLLVVVISILLTKALLRIIDRADKKYEKFDSTLVPILNTLVRATIFLVALAIFLPFLGVNTTSLVALIGTAGITIGLALKDTLANIASGIMILFLRPFKTGHYIECSSVSGTVKEIGLFSTTLETPDGLYIMAPNTSLWGSPIKNVTKNGKRRMDLVIGISYKDSIDLGFEVLMKIIKDDSRFLIDPLPQVMVHEVASSSINLQLRAWTKIDDYWNVYWETNKKIKENIESAGLTIPFPQHEINIVNK